MAVPTQPVEGFFFDELSKVRVVEPETAGQTQELKEECKEFVDSEYEHSYKCKIKKTSTKPYFKRFIATSVQVSVIFL